MPNESLLYVPLRESLYNALVLHYSAEGRPDTSIPDVIDSVVEDFLGRVREDYDVEVRQPERGLYWQSVFLPNGTQLRMTIRGRQYFSVVKDQEVHHEDKTFTPSSWANAVAGHARNAWRDIYVKRPTDQDWVFANQLRR